jgi:ABC-type multidrug transport system fused ATPase/permease subunit
VSDAKATAKPEAGPPPNAGAGAPASTGSDVPLPASGPRPAVVIFDKVGKTFENGHVAIRDVTFTVHDLPDRMEFVTILGPSGCGKSTV